MNLFVNQNLRLFEFIRFHRFEDIHQEDWLSIGNLDSLNQYSVISLDVITKRILMDTVGDASFKLDFFSDEVLIV